MSIAHVVPLRRFDATHWWFDYTIPADLHIQPGQLVEIPFLRRQLTGVVWNISDTSEVRNVKPITRLRSEQPIVTPWQRKVAETIALQTCSSLGAVLQQFVPEWPRRMVKLRKDIPEFQRIPRQRTAKNASPVWWYTDRSLVVRALATWVGTSGAQTRIIFVPTLEDGRELQQAITTLGGSVPLFSSELTPAQYRTLYQQVLNNELPGMIATATAIGLPFSSEPDIVLDQEEHPSYKQLLQQPRFDIREVIRELNVPHSVTTPAPSINLYGEKKPEAPIDTSPRQVFSMLSPRMHPWFTDRSVELLTEASPKKPIFVLAPQHGYASVMRCAQCGYIRACQWCGTTVRLFASRGQIAVCRNCQRPQSDHATCPSCHGIAWKFSGLGVDRVIETLKTLFPMQTIGTIEEPSISLAVGTYAAARKIPQRVPHATLLMSGDALLTWPDFSASERAWEFLHRLQAWYPAMNVAIQTFRPDDVFWEAWVNHNHRRWYDNEMQFRLRLGLPPTREHWVARRPTSRVEPSRISVTNRLKDFPQVHIEVADTIRVNQKSTERIVLSNQGAQPLRELLPWQTLFPYPWQVDTKPTSWLL